MLRGYLSRYYSEDGGAPDGGTPPSAQPPAQSVATFTQEQLNAALAEEKRKWKRQQDEAAAEAKRKADEDAKAKAGEWEKLANERAARVTELEQADATAQERLAAYEGVLTAQIKARAKALPEAARAKLPDGDPLAQLAWLDAVEAAVQAATPAVTKPVLRTPAGGTGSTAPQSASDLVAAKRASGDYVL